MAMPQTRRVGNRSVLLATATGILLSLTLALWVWASAGVAAPSQASPRRTSSTGTGAQELRPGSGDLPSGGPTSLGGADQLRSMDPAALDRYVASEEAAPRGGPSPSKAAKDTWLVGQVGTYLVGRGISAGTYESAGAKEGKICRWGVTGTKGDSLRSGSSSSRTVVTIHTTDGFFQTQDCSNWHKTS